MNRDQIIAIVLATYLAVFLDVGWNAPRNWLGTPVSFLPALLVYAAVQYPVWGVVIVSVFGGLVRDSYSGDPLGVSVAVLFALGFVLNRYREYVMHQLPFARMLLGFIAGAAFPLFGFLLTNLVVSPHHPSLSVLYTITIAALASAILTPLTFRLFARLHRTFTFGTIRDTSTAARLAHPHK
ncbi:MAG: rod shape-determining protein MreD [Limisphaerales bacterium]